MEESQIAHDLRVNSKIRSPQVRLVSEDVEQLGIKSLGDALAIARDAKLDLVEVAPRAQPPVCKLMDYGKFKYRQKTKSHDAKVHHHRVHTKEIRLHDKIHVNVFFKGREMAHRELGFDVLKRFSTQLEDVARVEQAPKVEGRRMTMILAPK